ncbi:MAG: insulinase family protein [Candidatus Aminicenantes bacterium]|nr:insulinase family protein [Candidatus Aminicenantes bacterium]TFG54925.1 MAG: insulinase family protein [Candidatus Aminicenantes bacterium]
MRKRAWLPFLLLAVFTLSLSAAFKKEDVKVHKLDNGLKVLLVKDHNIPSVALYTFFRVGSRNERPGLTGVSHFIEHMMFNGTPKVGRGAPPPEGFRACRRRQGAGYPAPAREIRDLA